MHDIDEDTDEFTLAVLAWIERQPEVLAKCHECAAKVWDESRKLTDGPFRAQDAAIQEIAAQIERGFVLPEYTQGSDISPLYNRLIKLALREVVWIVLASRFVMEHAGFEVKPVHPRGCECDWCTCTVPDSDGSDHA